VPTVGSTDEGTTRDLSTPPVVPTVGSTDEGPTCGLSTPKAHMATSSEEGASLGVSAPLSTTTAVGEGAGWEKVALVDLGKSRQQLHGGR
jgi:hypothetical protein